MPIQHAIWKVGAKPSPLAPTTLVNEQQLEEMIIAAPEILSSEWMIIGRQESTGFGGRIDLLAMAPDASLVLIELKRHRTPREIIAQALDYASWVDRLTADRIADIYRRFSNGGSLDAAFLARFGTKLDEELLNASHQILLVAAELDDSTERIIEYLAERDIAINVLFFRVFEYANERLLSRAWLIDPRATVEAVASGTRSDRLDDGPKEPWNGEFYASFSADRDWSEARRYGFIRGGGGVWYSQTLKLLSPGDRVWVKIPGTGYVGVGRVLESACPVGEFTVEVNGRPRPALEVLSGADKLRRSADDPEKAEYFVRMAWLETRSEADAFDEVGLFGIQHTVCRPSTPKWRHTIERLKTQFPNWDRAAERADPTSRRDRL